MTSGNREHAGPLAFLDRERILLLVLGLVLFLPGLGRHDLWNPDEPRCAEVAREMLETSDFLVPQLNGEPYTQEPPLHFWAIGSISMLLGGLDETAVRLPSALAAIATSVLVYAIALRLFSSRVAWLAALVFMSSYKVLWQGRTGQVGMVLTLWTTLALYAWVRGILEDRPGFYLVFFAALGLATLTRGWEGSIPPVLTMVVFMSISGRLRDLRRLFLGPGILIWFAITLGWLLPAARDRTRRFLEPTGHRADAALVCDRLGSAPPGRVETLVLLLRHRPHGLPPMVSFVPNGGLDRLESCPRSSQDAGCLLLSSWIVVTVTLFSLSPVKRSVNVLTIFPAMALVVGFGLDRALEAWPRFKVRHGPSGPPHQRADRGRRASPCRSCSRGQSSQTSNPAWPARSRSFWSWVPRRSPR